MGVWSSSSSSRFVLLLLWMVLINNVGAETICRLPGCNCTHTAAQWKTINCTLQPNQELNLMQHTVPFETEELFIDGGLLVNFDYKALTSLKALSLVFVKETKEVVIGKRSFYDLTSPSLLIRIQGCHHLRIMTGAFDLVQSSLTTEIEQCKSVEIEKPSFGKLSSALFRAINNLTLSEKTFELHTGSLVGSHGPVTTITFDDVNLLRIPKETFYSTVAAITLTNSKIITIEKGAFSAKEIPSILINSTVINAIQSDAFSSATLIINFEISNCTIDTIESRAILSAFTNLTVQHSTITDVQTGAINTTAANFKFFNNQIRALRSSCLVIQNWNRIAIEKNTIKSLKNTFLVSPMHEQGFEVRFVANEVYELEQGALNYVPDLPDNVFVFKDNLLNTTCHCSIDEYYRGLINSANSTRKIQQMMETTFCIVSDWLSQCFNLTLGQTLNTRNFTRLVCNSENKVVCEPYNGQVKIVNTTSKIFTMSDPPLTTNWITVIIVAAVILLLLAIASFVIILVRGSRWLKRKGCFRKIQYNQSPNEASNDEENTIETVDEMSEKQDDLTLELLQNLSQKLDDPSTHQEASEMIEQLYQKYIRNSENNNQQLQANEDAHLYEELGNLQMQLPVEEADEGKSQNGARSILRLMEEKFNTQFEDIDAESGVYEGHNRPRPTLSEYSEPSDAAVHLYSELKQSNNAATPSDCENATSDSLKSKASSNMMASRPLPDKPSCSSNLG